MAPKYPLGTKSANGAYAIGKNGHTLPLEYVPMLGSLLKGASNFDYGGGRNYSGNPINPSNSGSSTPAQGSAAPGFQWQFPQYSQTWAFTPPAPSPYTLPPAFDPKSPTGYAKDVPVKKTSTRSKTALSPFSLPDLMTKYK
jgi:hypothetical protein